MHRHPISFSRTPSSRSVEACCCDGLADRLAAEEEERRIKEEEEAARIKAEQERLAAEEELRFDHCIPLQLMLLFWICGCIACALRRFCAVPPRGDCPC